MRIIQGNPNAVGDIISVTLENRGITDIVEYLNPTNYTPSDPLKFTRSDEAEALLFHHISIGSIVGVLIDADMDGYSAATLTNKYLLDINPNMKIVFFFHEGKAHGLTDAIMKQVKDSDIDLLIIPDAGSNDVEQMKELDELGIDILVLDHHEVDKFSEVGVIVNNQLCENTNKHLVGAGVVYQFFKRFDEKMSIGTLDNYLDLVAIGQIGDSSDIAVPEIRALVTKGVQNLNNKFFRTVIDNLVGEGINPAPREFSFTLIPLVNAVVRVGTLEERQLIFEAMNDIGAERTFEVKKRKKNANTGKFDTLTFEYDLYTYAWDVATKVKARQAALVKKLVAALEESTDHSYGIAIAQVPDNIDVQGVSGLVANKLVNKYDKPSLVLSQKEETWTGSGRGYEKVIADFRQWCEKSDLVEFAQGHANAFGIGIHSEKLEAFKDYAKKIEAPEETVYEVDLILEKLDGQHAELIDRNRHLFGGSVTEPFIGVQRLKVPKRFISFRGSVFNIYTWGVSCVQFGANVMDIEDKLNRIDGNEVLVTMVGEYSMNNWNGKKTPQFIIKDIEFESVEELNKKVLTADDIIF